MVNEYAGQLLADSLGHEHGGHRGIHAAGQGAECPAIADFFFEFGNGLFHEGIHLPIANTATDIIDEIFEHNLPLHRMHNFRMELDSIEIFGCIFHSRYGADRRICSYRKGSRCLGNIVRMTHPANGLFIHTGK